MSSVGSFQWAVHSMQSFLRCILKTAHFKLRTENCQLDTADYYAISQIVTPCLRDASASGRFGTNSCPTKPL